jgi:hypothetical protein
VEWGWFANPPGWLFLNKSKLVPEAQHIRSRKIGVCQTAGQQFFIFLAKTRRLANAFAFWSDLLTFFMGKVARLHIFV